MSSANVQQSSTFHFTYTLLAEQQAIIHIFYSIQPGSSRRRLSYLMELQREFHVFVEIFLASFQALMVKFLT